MRRREFVRLLGCAAAASWPVAARGRQSRMPVVGFLSARSSDESASRVAFFQRGLNEAGYVEGRSVAIDYRWADGRYDRLPELASDLVSRRVSVLAAVADPAPQVAKGGDPDDTHRLRHQRRSGQGRPGQQASTGRAAMPPVSPYSCPTRCPNGCSCCSSYPG